MKVQLLLIFAFLISIPAFSQSEEIEHCESLIKNRKYWKSYKKAKKYYQSTDNGIFLLYQAGLLYKLRKHKKIIKTYKDVIPTVINLLKEADPKDFPEDIKMYKLKQLMVKLFPVLRGEIKNQFGKNGVASGVDLLLTIYKIYNPHFEYLVPSEDGKKILHPYDDIDANMRIYQRSSNNDYDGLFEFLEARFYFSDLIVQESKFAFVEKAGKRTLYVLQKDFYRAALDLYKSGDLEAAKAKLETICTYFNNESNSRENYYLSWMNDSLTDVLPKAFYENRLFKIPDSELERLKSAYDLSGFSDDQIKLCHTAYYETYLNETEKDLFLMHNLVRIYPKTFNNNLRKIHYEDHHIKENEWSKSLITDLNEKDRGFPLYSNSQWFEYARYHAQEMGDLGTTGHESASKESAEKRKTSWLIVGSRGENCSYGLNDAQDIIMQLLIDDGVESKGHRRNILSRAYLSAGISIWEHSKWTWNTVLDYAGS